MGRFDPVWASLDATTASGWAPGIVAAVRHEGVTETCATGATAAGGTDPMRPDTLFRIASLSKPVGAVIALSLVADGVFALEDPVERWLPELARPRVLRTIDADLDDTVPAQRPITVRHLLTMTFGLGLVLGDRPLAAAIRAAGLGPAAIPPAMTGDAYLAAVGALPLAFQPGDGWLYHSGTDVLTVLMTRATGRSAADLLAERITGPLGLTSTAFVAVDPSRLAHSYLPTPAGLVLADPPEGEFARPRPFDTFASGLVSTAPEYLVFLAALADGRLLPPDLLAALTADQLTEAQRADMALLAGPGRSFGLGVGVETARVDPWTAPGRYGWTGGSGTSANVDPSRDLIGVVFTQRLMSSALEPYEYFWGPLARSVDTGQP